MANGMSIKIYPFQMAYDPDFGHRTELHTFRAGTGWDKSSLAEKNWQGRCHQMGSR